MIMEGARKNVVLSLVSAPCRHPEALSLILVTATRRQDQASLSMRPIVPPLPLRPVQAPGFAYNEACFRGWHSGSCNSGLLLILTSFLSKYMNSILSIIYLSYFQQFPSGKAYLCIIIKNIILTHLVQVTLLSNWEIHVLAVIREGIQPEFGQWQGHSLVCGCQRTRHTPPLAFQIIPVPNPLGTTMCWTMEEDKMIFP